MFPDPGLNAALREALKIPNGLTAHVCGFQTNLDACCRNVAVPDRAGSSGLLVRRSISNPIIITHIFLAGRVDRS